MDVVGKKSLKIETIPKEAVNYMTDVAFILNYFVTNIE